MRGESTNAQHRFDSANDAVTIRAQHSEVLERRFSSAISLAKRFSVVIRGAKAGAEGALAGYEQKVLLALEESENAFSDYSKHQERLVSLIRQSESSQSAANLAGVQ